MAQYPPSTYQTEPLHLAIYISGARPRLLPLTSSRFRTALPYTISTHVRKAALFAVATILRQSGRKETKRFNAHGRSPSQKLVVRAVDRGLAARLVVPASWSLVGLRISHPTMAGWLGAIRDGVLQSAAPATFTVDSASDTMASSVPSIRTLSKLAVGGAQVLLGGGQTVLGGTPATCSNPQLSCHNTTIVQDLCCFNAPGGQLLQTQFWDYSPATGPDDSWTIHGLWYVVTPSSLTFSKTAHTEMLGLIVATEPTTRTAIRAVRTRTSPTLSSRSARQISSTT